MVRKYVTVRMRRMTNNPKKKRRWGKQIGKMEEDKKNSNIGRNSKKKQEETEAGNESRKEQRKNERGGDKKKERER